LFVGGGYAPLRAAGRASASQHVAAFARGADGQSLIVAAPVLMATLMRGALAPPIGADVWRDDWLPVPAEVGRAYCDLFSGQILKTELIDGRAGVRLRDVFGNQPVAALLAD
jgi:maltooligosyltrehalose synthase